MLMVTKRIRKHIPTENYIGWTERIPGGLFQELSAAEAESIEAGAEAFALAHPDVQLFPDPFLPARKLHSAAPVQDLTIVSGESDLLKAAAAKLATAIRELTGTTVAVKRAADLRDGLMTAGPLVLIGLWFENALSREILRRHQLGIFDAQFPGSGGWGITCHGELAPGMDFRYLLACDESTVDAAIGAFVNSAIDQKRGTLRWMHEVSPGPELKRDFPDFHSWLKSFIRITPKFNALQAWEHGGFARPYREVFVECMTVDCAEEIISNGRLIDMGVEGLRYYQQMGDVRGLELFREMIYGLWSFLSLDCPEFYPSDIDFRMGAVCDAWNWAEWHPSVSGEELDMFPKVLLGAMRVVRGYFLHLWKYRRLERKKPAGNRGEIVFCHNHETFPALCLARGERYFRHWRLPETADWLADAEYIFSAIKPESFKYSENANSYEHYVPEHYLTWLETTGREIPQAFRDSMAKFALRQWMMRDNTYRMVDYGDSGLGKFTPARPFVVSPWLDRANPLHKDIIEYEELTGGHFAPDIVSTIRAFTGLVASNVKGTPRVCGDWEVMPVDPLFGYEFSFEGPSEKWFDKVCLREAWQPDAFYLAIEGIGAGNGISHGHHEVNGIVRANFGGRCWLVSNGYGKRIGVYSAGQAWMTRQTGPIDHNMLIMRNAGEGKPILPPVNALLIDRRMDPIPVITTALDDYGGCRWLRHTVVLNNRGLVVVDRLTPTNGEKLPDEVWLEWNIPGDIKPDGNGALVDQRGVVARFHHFGSGACEWGEIDSADWYSILNSGDYPYASWPLRKAIIRATAPAECGPNGLTFVTGLWLDDAVTSVFWDTADSRLEFTVAGSGAQSVLLG